MSKKIKQTKTLPIATPVSVFRPFCCFTRFEPVSSVLPNSRRLRGVPGRGVCGGGRLGGWEMLPGCPAPERWVTSTR